MGVDGYSAEEDDGEKQNNKTHLEFFVALRLAERRFAAVVVGRRRRRCGGATSRNGLAQQFPLARLAEAGQPPFEPERGKKKRRENDDKSKQGADKARLKRAALHKVVVVECKANKKKRETKG